VSRLSYFKCDPDAALHGTQGMSDALFKVYVRLFWHMYSTGGPVRFDEQKLKFLVEKRPQDVRKLVGELIEMGKLTLDENGFLHNGRTDLELEKWRRNDGEMTEKWRPNGDQMEPHLASHNSEKPNDPMRAPAHAHDRIKNKELRTKKNKEKTHTYDFEKKFAEFWSAYPKREGGNPKHPARLKFMTAVKDGANPDSIIEAARLLAREHPVPTRFVPMAQTWLYQQRFADSVEAKAAAEDDLARQVRLYEERIARERADERQGILHPLS
jgi:hypothetical protein